MPEAVDEAYTKERLQSGLAYAVKFLKRRDIYPRSENLMEIFKDEVGDTLMATSADAKKLGAIAVRVYETLIEENAFLWVPNFSEDQELETNLLQLRELSYLARMETT